MYGIPCTVQCLLTLDLFLRLTSVLPLLCPFLPQNLRAAIQRRGSILAWIVILSFYGADTIAIDLSLSALIS
jgi:hypothetical protein